MNAYVPGKQPDNPNIIKLNTNENPFPPSEKIKNALKEKIDQGNLHKYPDPLARELKAKLAEALGSRPERILIGNGSDEILSLVFRAVLDHHEKVTYSRPTYSLYPILTAMTGASDIEVEVNGDWTQDLEGMLRFASGTTPMGFFTPQARLSVIANPNAPTGIAEPSEAILNYAFRNQALTLVDEAYISFGGESVASLAGTDRYPRLMVSGTFSKSYSLAGQRIGWLVAHPELIEEITKIKDSYNISTLAQAAGIAALEDVEEYNRRIEEIKKNRDHLGDRLKGLGFTCLDSSANFIFARPPIKQGNAARAALDYFNFLESNGILIRYFTGNIRIEEYVRISIGTREQIDTLLEKTEEFVKNL